MRATTLLLTAGLCFCSAWPYAGGAPAGYAGVPPDERTCVSCHRPTADAPPLPNQGAGTLEIVGLPARYELGGPIVDATVVLREPGKVRWGFQLAAVGRDRKAGGTVLAPPFPAGRYVHFVVEATGTPPLSYLTQTVTGTQWSDNPEDIGGPVYWPFRWQPPPQYTVGDILFHVSGVAADGDTLPTGDDSYATTVRVGAPPDLSGDLSGDGRINYLDYLLFSLRWMNSGR